MLPQGTHWFPKKNQPIWFRRIYIYMSSDLYYIDIYNNVVYPF